MGLFDFFKSKEQKEKEDRRNLVQKLMDAIFPGGQKQIDEEVRTVRELLNFRYSKNDTYLTYIHAASMLYTAKDKSKERIVTSILLNKDSVVSRHDAELIYKYLKEKHTKENLKLLKTSAENARSILDSMNEEQRLLMVAKGGIVELKKSFTRVELTNKGKYEVLLFNSLLISRRIIEKYGDQPDGLKEKFFLAVVKAGLNEYKITNDIDVAVDFLNRRMIFYAQELRKLSTDDTYMPMKIYTAFYKKSLHPHIEVDENLNMRNLLDFCGGLLTMSDWVRNGTERIL